MRPLLFFLCVAAALPVSAAPVPERGVLSLQPVPGARFEFGGIAGERIAANIDGWLLAAPRTNPGMLEMFRQRDRQPVPQLVPWAGEFAGKYLLSCVSALRESERPDLHKYVSDFVAALLAIQAEDGYMGPFPADRRLLGEWDLWGHYHVMLGLLDWHDLSGDAPSLAAVRKAADLICKTYLDGTRRVMDAGSEEMNMAISHVMAVLHRRTGEPRYLRLVQEIEKDWERAGDYLRTGVAGTPFYKTPKPRWESLHDLQTLVEMWRITGEAKYRDAFVSHWRTIREFDIRNSGAFSGGEQATGNAFAPTPIETCCTVAWMALTVDMLKLTGDTAAAEELERATFNGALGSQHPCGRWWTYNTPMDGDRKSSAHDIVFQARAGTPELNCCSVNGPRTPGMLADWAVMSDGPGIVVNTHIPGRYMLRDKNAVLICESQYPVDGRIRWRIESRGSLRVRFLIPSWAQGARVAAAGQALDAKPGTYCAVERVWTGREGVDIQFPMTLRSMEGRNEQKGRISVFRGPLLLAWDQRDNEGDEYRIPRLSPENLASATVEPPSPSGFADAAPWVKVTIPAGNRLVRLRDFATAGMNGTRYRSWLRGGAVPATPGAPPVLRALSDETVLNGTDQMFTQPLPDSFAAGDYSVAVRVKLSAHPEKRLGQIFSAWCAPGDDPLRLVMQNGRVHARIESGAGAAGTSGAPLEINRWYHVAAVKEGALLTLYVNGLPVSTAVAPATVKSGSRLLAVGGNPLYRERPEFLGGVFRDLSVWTRALTDEEVEAAAR